MKKGGNPNWKKGQSGNPGGRPKANIRMQDLARSHTVEAIHTLHKAMTAKGSTWSTRVSAAVHLLDRGHGKPVSVNISKRIEDMSREEIAALVGEDTVREMENGASPPHSAGSSGDDIGKTAGSA